MQTHVVTENESFKTESTHTYLSKIHCRGSFPKGYTPDQVAVLGFALLILCFAQHFARKTQKTINKMMPPRDPKNIPRIIPTLAPLPPDPELKQEMCEFSHSCYEIPKTKDVRLR